MRAFLLLLIALPAWAAELPHLDIDVRLDPGQRSLAATATLTVQADRLDIHLLPTFTLTRLVIDGHTQRLPAPTNGDLHLTLPGAGPHQLQFAYQGRLASLPELDHREVLAHLPPMADVRGSFLPAGSGWYPDPGVPFSYRLHLRLPAGQKGLAPGTLVRESETDDYQAEYDFAQPAEGIDLMAGPYAVNERLIARPGQPTLRLRTWFYTDMADLAAGYLDDSARYIDRYSTLIGPYPFDAFSIVASPLPTGFGMPSLTYLGRDVLRLPFIRATSLGHEVLHNWWGNGVIPDWATGNWSEGLTTFMADYTYQEDQSDAAARQARLGWLRDLAAVPAAEDTPLTAFTTRHHGISSIVGYDKAAMLFLMLRDRIGTAAFEQGLRLFWQRHRFQKASWTDLKNTFSTAAGQNLADFFQTWVNRAGAPQVTLQHAAWAKGTLELSLAQSRPPYPLRLPVRLLLEADQTEIRWLDVTESTTRISLPAPKQVKAVDLDPDYRVWRRVGTQHFPPILREIFIAPRVGLLLTEGDKDLARTAAELAERVLDVRPQPVQATGSALPGSEPVLIIGQTTQVEALLTKLGLPPPPPQLAGAGSAQVWAARNEKGRPYTVIAARNNAALSALQRPLPHYGRQSWLVFDAARALNKGVWPPQPERIEVEIPSH
jgi:hypothetical protein